MKEFVIKKVESGKELGQFIEFPYALYRDYKNYVPPLRMEQRNFFTKNPALEVASMQLFLAFQNGEVVGRVGGIIHSLENEKLKYKRGRFGFFECLNNESIGIALLSAVQNWLKDKGCVEMTGPHAFTDLDMEGLLIEGFDELPPITCCYHMPYYQKLVEKFGLQKDVDYIEHHIVVPQTFPVYERMKDKLLSSSDYRLLPLTKMSQLKPYLPQFWPLMEECYSHLHGVTPLTQKQKDDYTKNYFGFLDPDFVKIALDQSDRVVGFFVGMPNLSHAFQKAKGRLLPWGIFHILCAFKKVDTVDFVLIGVKPGIPKTSVMMLMMGAMYDSCKMRGIRFFESNRQLETNFTIADVWKRFDSRLHRRSRMYRMDL